MNRGRHRAGVDRVDQGGGISNGDGRGALARKAAQGRASAPQPLAMTPPRALALALSRVADTTLSLPLRVAGVQPRALSLADLPEAIMDQALIAVVEGPGEGLGIVALCPVTVASLIEVQTMGRLSHRPVAPRRPTRTDAALAAPFLDAVLAGFESLLDGLVGQDWAAGYRYASFLDDPRPLDLMLEDGALRGLMAEVVLGADGQRAGRLLVALPAQPRQADPSRTAATHPAAMAAQAAAARAAQRWQDDLEDRVLGAEVVVNGVLARIDLPASALMSLAPGAVLPLPDGATRALRLEAAGQVLSQGRLGQHRGARAIRLTDGHDAAPTGEPDAPLSGDAMVPAAGAFSLALPDRGANDAEEHAAPPAFAMATPLSLGDLPPLAMGDLPALSPGQDSADDQPEALAPLPMQIGAFG